LTPVELGLYLEIMEGPLPLLEGLAGQLQLLVRRLKAYQRLSTTPGTSVYQRAQALAEIQQAVTVLPEAVPKQPLREWHQAEQAVVQQLKDDCRFQFVTKLIAELEGAGMTVKGQLPLLRVGLFTVRVDFDAGTASIFWGPEIERLKTGITLEPTGLAKLLRRWKESLESKAAVSPEEFARRLHTGYQRICSLNGLNEGTRVFLIDLLAELVLLMQPPSFRVNPAREKFVEYPRIRFSYDLFRLKRAAAFQVGTARLRLHVANFAATAEKAKALWVPDNEEGAGTHYSYISFTTGA